MIRVETKRDAEHDRFDVPIELKLADSETETGVFEGYASVFNLMDRGGDIILPKAFKQSIAAWKKKKLMPAMLWNHRYYSDELPIGRWIELSEDDVGLRVKGSVNVDFERGKEIYSGLKHGSITGMSIGWICREHDVDRATGVRMVKRADLIEISLVGVPMLDEARVDGVKSFGFDPRRLERALKAELNLSNDDAVTAVSIVKKHLRDGDGRKSATPEPATDLILSLRKAATVLQR